MQADRRKNACGPGASQALLLCSDLLAFSHVVESPPAAAKTLLLALRARQAGSSPAASGRLAVPPPQ
jgi:hypothetical protein